MDRQREIHFEMRDMQNNRRAKMLEYMKEFDKAYDEKREQLINECGAIGHKSTGAFHDNGWGVTWRYCDYCGAAFDKVNHNETELLQQCVDQKKPDVAAIKEQYKNAERDFLKNLQAIHGKEEGLRQYNEIMEREQKLKDFVNKQEPLGEEFEKVLNDNLWNLYED